MANKDTIRIAKDFRWEMGHRLPFHAGLCRNIHGHSYRLRVCVEGATDPNGMVIDYFDLATIVEPIVDMLDHAFLCDENDTVMRDLLTAQNMKHVIVPFTTTAENLCTWLLEQITEKLRAYPNMVAVDVRVCETERTFAEKRGEIDS